MPDQSQFEQWKDQGFLYLKRFYDSSEVNLLNSIVERAWNLSPNFIVVDHVVTGKRSYMSSIPTEERETKRFKVNDLYLNFASLRSMVMKQEMLEILTVLLGDKPVLCNTLNLEKGSEQPDHTDTLYMTPRTFQKVVATWTALEDVHPDAGALRFYPMSHKIQPFLFSDGSYHAIDSEMPDWEKHTTSEVKRLGLQPELLLAEAGDVFIWHANLLHGGSKIIDAQRTRKSLVSHFWSAQDCLEWKLNIQPIESGGFWYKRPAQPVPDEPTASNEPPQIEQEPALTRFRSFLQRLFSSA